MKRPNPNNGFTMGDEQKLRAEFEKRVEGIVREAERQARHKLFAELGITDLGAASTPGARWMAEADGQNPFPDLINRERGSLCLGSYTDFELANEVFLKADMSDEEKVRNLLAGKVTPIALLTAAKERIRWLSTHLEAALSRENMLIQELSTFGARLDKVGDSLAALVPMPFDEMVLLEDGDKAGLVQKRIGDRGNHPVYETGALDMVISDAEVKRKEELIQQVETLAKEIHDLQKDQKDWVEWVPFGSSNAQQTARFKALSKLTDDVMKNAHVMTSNCRTDKGESNAKS